MNLAATHEEISDDSGWYVVYSKARQEKRAMENLGNQGFRCFLPTIRVQNLHGGRFSVFADQGSEFAASDGVDILRPPERYGELSQFPCAALQLLS